MESFDAFRVSAGGKSCKRDENIVGEHDDVAMTVKDSRMVLDIIRVCDRHQKRRFHVDCTVQPENSREALVHDVIEGDMLGHVCFVIVQEPARWLGWLVEQGGENSLQMRRVWLGY